MSQLLLIYSNLNVQEKVKVSATYFSHSLNHHDKLFPFAGFTPLHIAAGTGSIEIVKLLVDSGADVQKAAEQGKTFPVLLLLCWQI